MTVAASAPRFRVVDFPDRATWLQARAGMGVGSSESPALFSRPENPLAGLSTWDSPISLSYRKRGIIPLEPDRKDDNLAWGLHVEPAITSWFDRKVLAEIEPFQAVIDPGQFAVFMPAESDNFPWFATVDRLIVPDGGGVDDAVAILEIKNDSAWMASEWSEEPPLIYQIQVQHQLGVTGLPLAYLCASIGGEAPRWAKVARDEKIIRIIRHRIGRFWRALVENRDPEVDAHDATAAALLSRWPQDSGERIGLGDSEARDWTARQRIHEAINLLDLRKALLTNRLKHRLGSATFGDLPDGRVLSLKTSKNGQRNLKEVLIRG